MSKYLSLIVIFVLVIIFLYITGIGCPIKFVSGISCPGCGLTRAWLAFLHLDIKGAFYYHPLFFLVPFIIALVICKDRVNKRVYNILMCLIIMAYVIIYAIRLLQGSDIVVFKPYDNILFRLIRTIKL